MKMPKNPMPKKEKIMKKIKETLEKRGETESKVDLKNIAVELSERREGVKNEETEE